MGPIAYPAAFELVWERTGRRGGKFPAFKAWKKVGKPDVDAIGARWSAYMLSERPVAGFVKDLSSWLNGRGHEQDWQPVRAAPPDTRCAWHKRPGNDARPSAYPDKRCDRCRHFAAASAGRESSPEVAADVMPSWASAPPPAAWTPEQIAEAEELRAARQADADRRGAAAHSESSSRG